MNDELLKRFKEHFSSRLKTVRESKGLSRNKVSDITGLAISTLQTWENGDRLPNALDIYRLSQIYETPIYELFEESFEPDASNLTSNNIRDNAGNPVDLNEFTFIPRYNVSASAGNGCAINDESYTFSMAYRTYWIKKYLEVNPKDLIALTAKGDSMTGVIDDRDVMLVDMANKTLSDGIYVLRLDGDLLVKRAQKLPNQIIRISSANPVYEPFDIDMTEPPNDFEVIGAVVHTEPGTLFRYRKN